MRKIYPKFDQKIQEQISRTQLQQPRSRPGVIMAFDKYNNTATIVLDDHNTELMGAPIHGVPCPVNKGIQSVAPSIGTRCLVGFRDTNESDPYVLNYFEDTSRNPSFTNSYIVDTGVPRFLVN